jgi:hypothetical protein
VLYTNTGAGGALEAFDTTTIDTTAYGFSAASDLFTFWDVTSQAELNDVINWAIGYTNDGTTTPVDTARGGLLGDMLHGKPLVVNYGARGTFTKTNPELRIAVGTNGSFLHMFGNDNGAEDWAFVPKELGPVITRRFVNNYSSNHAYGIDSPPIVHVEDRTWMAQSTQLSATRSSCTLVCAEVGRRFMHWIFQTLIVQRSNGGSTKIQRASPNWDKLGQYPQLLAFRATLTAMENPNQC